MPGAGKTTVTDLVGRRLPHAAQVGGDAVNEMIRSGFVWFMGQPTDEALRHDELCNRNMCALANNFIDFGFTVLMDTVLADRAELDFFIALMSPRPVRLVVLAPRSTPSALASRRRNSTGLNRRAGYAVPASTPIREPRRRVMHHTRATVRIRLVGFSEKSDKELRAGESAVSPALRAVGLCWWLWGSVVRFRRGRAGFRVLARYSAAA